MNARSRSAIRRWSSTASWRRRTCHTIPTNTHVMSGISESSARLSTERSIATEVTAITAPSTTAVCSVLQRRKPYRNVSVIQIQWNGTVCHCGTASMATAHARQNAPHASSPRRSRIDDVAPAADGVHGAAPQLVAQTVDVDIDDVRLRVEVDLPHRGEQLLARARAPRARGEVQQDAELAFGQRDGPRAGVGGA